MPRRGFFWAVGALWALPRTPSYEENLELLTRDMAKVGRVIKINPFDSPPARIEHVIDPRYPLPW